MFRNRVINGDMRIAQRGQNVVTGTGLTNTYLIDRFQVVYNITTGGLTQSNIGLGSNDSPYASGFRNSWRITASTACSSYVWILPAQYIEANNVTDLNWGSPYGQPVTVSFWLRTNLASNSAVPFSLRNFNAGSTYYSYVTNVATTGSGSWQYATSQPHHQLRHGLLLVQTVVSKFSSGDGRLRRLLILGVMLMLAPRQHRRIFGRL